MKTQCCDLSAFSPDGFDKGGGFLKQALWYFINAMFVRASWNPFMSIKIAEEFEHYIAPYLESLNISKSKIMELQAQALQK